MAIKYKQQKNEVDITHLVSTRIEQDYSSIHSILIYLIYEEQQIGFFSKKGFCPMLGTEKKYRIVSTDTLGGRPSFPTWFKVFRRKGINDQ